MFSLKDTYHAIFGVANQDSICWSIAECIRAAGGEVVLISHPAIVRKGRLQKIASSIGIHDIFPCDVSDAESMEECFKKLAGYAPFDGVVHGIAFSNKDELRGRFVDTTADNFKETLEISAHSLTAIAHRMERMMPNGGSILTLTFDAWEGTYPNYNVMAQAKAALRTGMLYLAADFGEGNIRVNAVSASPEDTPSARGIGNFRLLGKFAEAMSPMRRRATKEEIAKTAVFLLGPGSTGITGQTIYVDCGASSSTMPPARNADLMAEAMASIAETYQKELPDDEKTD